MAEELIDALADLPTEVAESLVHGASGCNAGPLVSVSGGIWRKVSPFDETNDKHQYRLIGADDQDEWAGTIVGENTPGYTRVEIRSYFILERWPEFMYGVKPLSLQPLVSRAEIRRLIATINSSAPDDLVPLAQGEMVSEASGARLGEITGLAPAH